MKKLFIFFILLVVSLQIVYAPCEEGEICPEDASTSEEIGNVIDSGRISELNVDQLRNYGLQNLNSEQLERCSDDQINSLTQDDAQTYFSGESNSLPRDDLSPNEKKLWLKINKVDLDDKILQAEGIVYGDGIITSPQGTKVNFGSESPNIGYTEDGRLKVGDIIVDQGEVSVNSDGSYTLSSGSEVETVEGGAKIKAYIEKRGEGDELERVNAEPVTLYTKKPTAACTQCVVVDADQSYAYVNGNAISLQLGQEHNNWYLETGDSIGINYILDKNGNKALKITDGKINQVVGGDASNSGFSTFKQFDGKEGYINSKGECEWAYCPTGTSGITAAAIVDITGNAVTGCKKVVKVSGIVTGKKVELSELDHSRKTIKVNGQEAKVLVQYRCIGCFDVELPDGQVLEIRSDVIKSIKVNTVSGYVPLGPNTGLVGGRTTNEDNFRIAVTNEGDKIVEDLKTKKTFVFDSTSKKWYVYVNGEFFDMDNSNIGPLTKKAMQQADGIFQDSSSSSMTQGSNTFLTEQGTGSSSDKIIKIISGREIQLTGETRIVHSETTNDNFRITITSTGDKIIEDLETKKTWAYDSDSKQWIRFDQQGNQKLGLGELGRLETKAIEKANSITQDRVPFTGSQSQPYKAGETVKLGIPDYDKGTITVNGQKGKIEAVYKCPGCFDVMMPNGQILEIRGGLIGDPTIDAIQSTTQSSSYPTFSTGQKIRISDLNHERKTIMINGQQAKLLVQYRCPGCFQVELNGKVLNIHYGVIESIE